MKPTRRRILDHLDQFHGATAAELSQMLQLTAANIRYHLAILVEQGQVEAAGNAAQPGAGRPARLYRRARQAHNLDGLAHALLDELAGSQPAAEAEAMLLALAHSMARTARSGEDQDQPGAGRHLTVRLSTAVQQLEPLGYQPRWEAHVDGPRIRLGHCPYRAVLDEHPELCRLDTYLLTNLVGQPVEQIAKLARSTRGAPYCLFHLSDPSA